MTDEERRSRNLQAARDAVAGRTSAHVNHQTPHYKGLDLSLEASAEWDDDDIQDVAEALGIPVERIERDMWGCDTCGYGSTVLVLGWASEEDLRCLPKIPIEPKTWPTSVIYEVGRTRTVVTTSEDGTVCVSKEAVITETLKPRY